MSGVIAGLLRLDGAEATGDVADRLAAATMEVTSIHPGAFWINGPIALAQFDLALPDRDRCPSTPVAIAPDGSVLVADIRLYDRSELASRLGAKSEWPDIHLLVRAHERFGEDALRQLHGDFAFARWNSQTSELQLGRDLAGVRPLYYVYRPGAWLAFASLTSILRHAGFASDAVDEQSVAQVALGDYDLGARSFLQDIRRVRPAHLVTIGGFGLRERRYWRLRPMDQIPASADLEDTAAELRAHLDRAVRRRLPASGPVGSHLSGGLDSSAIAVLAARAMAAEGRTTFGYSIQTPRRRRDIDIIDEAPFVAAITQGEPNLRTVIVDSRDLRLAADGEVDRDFPVVMPDAHPHERILSDAAARGIDPLLSGFGGHELASYNGRGTLAEDIVRLRWRHLLRELRAAGAQTGQARWRIMASQFDTYLLPETMSVWLNRLRGRSHPSQILRRFVQPQWTDKIQPLAFGPDTIKNRIALFEAGHLSVSMEAMAARAARHGTSFAFPFLDRQLMEFAIRLPSQFFVSDGQNRFIFRTAMKGVLPEMVRTRREKFMIDPTGTLVASEARERFSAAVRDLKSSPGSSEVFDLEALQQAIDELPAPAERKRLINQCASEGRQPNEEPIVFTWPLTLARFLQGQVKR